MDSSQRLVALETLISANQPDFYVVGTSLSEIQEHLLYKIEYGSFEAYIENQWDMSKTHAYRMIAAVKVINCLSPIGDSVPNNEAQARPLTGFSPTKIKTLWHLFLQSEQPITARNIRRFIFQQRKKNESKMPSTERISEAYQQAVENLLLQIDINNKEHWKTTSLKTALRWNKVCLNKIQENSDDK